MTDVAVKALMELLELCEKSADPKIREAAKKVRHFGSGEESGESSSEPPGDVP